jgi:hypothetical protein
MDTANLYRSYQKINLLIYSQKNSFKMEFAFFFRWLTFNSLKHVIKGALSIYQQIIAFTDYQFKKKYRAKNRILSFENPKDSTLLQGPLWFSQLQTVAVYFDRGCMGLVLYLKTNELICETCRCETEICFQKYEVYMWESAPPDGLAV